MRGASEPLVWVPMDHRRLSEDGQPVPYLVLADQYAVALREGARAQAVVFPLATALQIPALLGLVHGVMLSGSPSNVHPSHFGEPVADASLPLDTARDALTLELIRQCLVGGVPLLGICRGFQEINVAMGGSLHQQVHRVPGLADHREPAGAPLPEQYALRHSVVFAEGSVFARWAGAPSAQVNSLHGQGVHRLGAGLRAVGHAPDGLIEAVEFVEATAFACAVQWHPEWDCTRHTLDGALFAAFGEACRARRDALQGASNA